MLVRERQTNSSLLFLGWNGVLLVTRRDKSPGGTSVIKLNVSPGLFGGCVIITLTQSEIDKFQDSVEPRI